MSRQSVEVAIIGAGLAGLATAYYLTLARPNLAIAIVDPRPPMSLTSAQSGDNYRNWWPHQTMTAFTDRSIDLMEDIARSTDNVIRMTRRGYALATRRRDIDNLLAELHTGYGDAAKAPIRYHDGGPAATYDAPGSKDWSAAPDGVDVLSDRALIRRVFPSFTHDIAHVVHVRRAGDISGQQLGQCMLQQVRSRGGRRLAAKVGAIVCKPGGFSLKIDGPNGAAQLEAETIVNAAGPFAGTIAAMVDIALPIETVAQQKIAFEDRQGAIPRGLPFAIDLDRQVLDWPPRDRAVLAADPDTAWLAQTMPGGIHCRPDGGLRGNWIKLGWAYNDKPREPAWDADLDPGFPEIVLRGAAALSPALKSYYGRLPRTFSHYGGDYAMTRENWPLIGPMNGDGAFVVAALSGFGTMAACAAGELCAAWVLGRPQPSYAHALSLARYDDVELIAELTASRNRGVL